MSSLVLGVSYFLLPPPLQYIGETGPEMIPIQLYHPFSTDNIVPTALHREWLLNCIYRRKLAYEQRQIHVFCHHTKSSSGSKWLLFLCGQRTTSSQTLLQQFNTTLIEENARLADAPPKSKRKRCTKSKEFPPLPLHKMMLW